MALLPVWQKPVLILKILKIFEIPVLSLAEQKAIVARWRKAQDDIAAVQKRMEKQKLEIDARFFTDLGLRSPDQLS